MEKEEKSEAAETEDEAVVTKFDNDYTALLNKPIIYIALCMLFGLLCAVLSILTTRSIASSDGGVIYSFFVGILIVVLTIKYFKGFGIITALVNSSLFCLALKMELVESVINVGVNTLQALLIFLAFYAKNKLCVREQGKQDDRIYRNMFIISQLVIGIAFTCTAFVLLDTVISLRVFTFLEVALYAAYCIVQRKYGYALYACLICFVPSLISGLINGGLQFDSEISQRLSSMETWTLSNFVLLASFGFVFIEYLNPKRLNEKLSYGEVVIKFTTIIYFVATLLWDSIFFIIFYIGWLGDNLLPFMLPWFVGNMFLLANLYFNSHVEVGDKQTNAFKWYEERAVVAEKNTQFLISIITFLLPISSSLFKQNLNIGIISIFCINITCACLSIGLIWIPQREVKAMSLIKTLKTVFHLLTVSFLLLSATMIIVPNYS